MRDRELLAKSIVLGLAIAQGATRVAASEVGADESTGASSDLFEGLIAFDAADLDLGNGADRFQADLAAGNCDPSGCSANLLIEALDFGDTSGLPFETRGVYVQVGNRSDSFSPAANVTVRLSSTSANVRSSGCTQISPGTIDCPVGTLTPGQSSGRSVEFIPTNPQSTSAFLQATVQSTTPDPSSGNNMLNVSRATRPPQQRLARFVRFDTAACPAIGAELETTDPAGIAVGLLPPGPGSFDELIDNGTWLGAPTIASADTTPLSVVILLDNSAASPVAVLQSVKQAVRQSVQAWWADAASDGVPLPRFAIAATSAPDAVLAFTTDPAALDAQLGAIAVSRDASRLLDKLDGATTTLSLQSGRRAVIAVVASSDGEGSPGFVRERLVGQLGIPVYTLAQNTRVEPLARQIAQSSGGFRYLVDAGSMTGFNVVMDSIRAQSRLAWTAPSQGQPRRVVDFRQLDSFGAPIVQARGFYAQTGTGCASTCTVTRDLPRRYGQAFTVSLNIDPGPTPITFALLEQVPAGWGVNNISDGGRFLPDTNQIRWDGKTVGALSTYTYQASPPFADGLANFQPATSEFSGTVSVSGDLRPTCGDASSLVIPPHPADLSASRFINATRFDAYEYAWRHGQRWPRGEHPVPAAHLTRAGEIRYGGTGVYFRADIADPPWSWTGSSTGSRTFSAIRSVPSGYAPGQTLQVELAFQPWVGTYTGAVEEVPPAGWEVVSVSDGGVYDAATRTIRWGLFRDPQLRIVSYLVRPSADSTGEARFTGRYAVDGALLEFGGATSSSSNATPPLFSNGFE